MNDTELKTMNLAAIRIKCAELVGWVLGYTGATQWVSDPNGIRMGWSSMRKVADDALPNYHESADDALQLVEWMGKPENGGWFFSCSLDGDAWVVVFDKDGEEAPISRAESLPLAICLAFLKANNIEPEPL